MVGEERENYKSTIPVSTYVRNELGFDRLASARLSMLSTGRVGGVLQERE